MFVATLTHSPEQCFARKEYQAEARRWVEEMKNRAKKHGVKIHGAYLCPNEHVFYFILETDRFEAVSDLLGPPVLTHHSGRVSPVLTVEEAFGLSFIKGTGRAVQ